MNKINRFLSMVSILSISQIASAVVVTGYTSPNSAGGGVPVNWTGSVYDRTEEEAKKAGAEAAAKAEKESREKSRQECLTREAGQIATDELACQQRFDLGFAADVGACSSDGYVQCKDRAAATQAAGYKGCAVDASQRRTDLPGSYICKR